MHTNICYMDTNGINMALSNVYDVSSIHYILPTLPVEYRCKGVFGRKPLVLDLEQYRYLKGLGYKKSKIAKALGCHRTTLYRYLKKCNQ